LSGCSTISSLWSTATAASAIPVGSTGTAFTSTTLSVTTASVATAFATTTLSVTTASVVVTSGAGLGLLTCLHYESVLVFTGLAETATATATVVSTATTLSVTTTATASSPFAVTTTTATTTATTTTTFSVMSGWDIVITLGVCGSSLLNWGYRCALSSDGLCLLLRSVSDDGLLGLISGSDATWILGGSLSDAFITIVSTEGVVEISKIVSKSASNVSIFVVGFLSFSSGGFSIGSLFLALLFEV